MNKKLGEIVRKNRVDRGLSLRGYTLVNGINHTYLASIEKGGPHSLTIETLRRLARGMKLSLWELMLQAGYFEVPGEGENEDAE